MAHKELVPTVSIIISNYNYESFVGASIESALSQTYSNVQVIVVDDGSTDSSREIISKYHDSITPIYQDNMGQGSAVNSGFLASSGDIVIFLDSDDRLIPQCAARIVSMWNDDYSTVHYGIKLIDDRGHAISGFDSLASLNDYPTGNLQSLVLTKGGIRHLPTSANAFSRRYLLEVLPLDAVTWRKNSDVYLCFLAALYGLAGGINEELCEYRIQEAGGTFIGVDHTKVDNLKGKLNVEINIDRVIREKARRLNLSVDSIPVFNQRHFLKAYLAWKKLSGVDDKDLNDGNVNLSMSKSIVLYLNSIRASKDLSALKKLLFGCWGLLVYLLPRSFTKVLIRIGYAGL